MTNNNNNNNLITQCSGNHKNDQMRITLVPKHEIKKKKTYKPIYNKQNNKNIVYTSTIKI